MRVKIGVAFDCPHCHRRYDLGDMRGSTRNGETTWRCGCGFLLWASPGADSTRRRARRLLDFINCGGVRPF